MRVPSGRRVRDGSDDDDVDNEEEEVEDGDPREFVDIDGDDSDISSADVPLAKTKTKTRSTGAHAPNSRSAKAGPSQSRTKGKSSSKPTSEISDIESIASSATGIIDDRPMDERFRGMVKNDSELYLRILYYEPIHFDEFVSKAIRAGFKDRRDKGWKIALKKFLDFEVRHITRRLVDENRLIYRASPSTLRIPQAARDGGIDDEEVVEHDGKSAGRRQQKQGGYVDVQIIFLYL